MDEQYLNFGGLEISQKDFLNNSANNIQSYVANRPWSLKKADKFFTAYLTIMNAGVTGASNESGVWSLDLANNIDTSGMKNRDKEMLNEAANFILQQMQGITPKTTETETIIEKPKYEGTNTRLNDFIGGNKFGGRDWSMSEFDELDERDSTGRRGVANRILNLKNILTDYAQTLDKYDFEGTTFETQENFANKLNNAIRSLEGKTEVDLDIIDSLNGIGLNYREWFRNGLDDPSGYLDANRNPLTYGLYYEALAKQEAEAEAEALKAKLKAAYNNTLFFTRGSNRLMGRSAKELKTKYGDDASLIAALNEYSTRSIGSLTPDEQSELYGAYKYLANKSISDELYNKLKASSSKRYKNYSKNDFKKINGVDGYVWDAHTRQVIQIQNRNAYNTALNNTSLFGNILTDVEKLLTPISKEGWTLADTADVISMLGDIVSLGGLYANIGGTVTSLTADLYADITRKKGLNYILKNVAANLGWGLAGLLPGAKSTKLAAKATKLVTKAFMLAQSVGIILDPEIQESALKFTKPSEYKNISSKDLENLKYLFHAVTGGTNIAKSHFRAKAYRAKINKQQVTTKSGKKVNLTEELIKEINKEGAKRGQKAAESKFKEITNEEAAEGSFKFLENGRSKWNPTRYSSKVREITSDDQLLQGKHIIDLNTINALVRLDKVRPWYNWNKGYARIELGPIKNIAESSTEASGETPIRFTEPRHPKGIQDNNTQYLERLFSNAVGDNPRYTNRRTLKYFIDKGQEKSAVLKGFGEDINIKLNKDGNLTVSGFGENIKLKINADNFSHDLKIQTGKAIKQIREKSKKGLTKEAIESIRKLRKEGYFFKQGGQINKPAYLIISEFLNKLK